MIYMINKQYNLIHREVFNMIRLVGRPKRTWLESVEVDMAEPEIDREVVHDRKKWRRTVMKRKSNPIGKRTINR